jgi:hypothetical protein
MVLLDLCLDAALLGRIDTLRLHILALRSKAVSGIHANLERVSFPAEDVVGMLSISSVVSVAEVEGLRT